MFVIKNYSKQNKPNQTNTGVVLCPHSLQKNKSRKIMDSLINSILLPSKVYFYTTVLHCSISNLVLNITIITFVLRSCGILITGGLIWHPLKHHVSRNLWRKRGVCLSSPCLASSHGIVISWRTIRKRECECECESLLSTSLPSYRRRVIQKQSVLSYQSVFYQSLALSAVCSIRAGSDSCERSTDRSITRHSLNDFLARRNSKLVRCFITVS